MQIKTTWSGSINNLFPWVVEEAGVYFRWRIDALHVSGTGKTPEDCFKAIEAFETAHSKARVEADNVCIPFFDSGLP